MLQKGKWLSVQVKLRKQWACAMQKQGNYAKAATMTLVEKTKCTISRMYLQKLLKGAEYKGKAMKELFKAMAVIIAVLMLNGIATAIDHPEACKPKIEYKEISSAEEKDLPTEIAEQYGLDPRIVKAIIKIESNGDSKAVGDNGQSVGLMQIQPKWHKARIDKRLRAETERKYIADLMQDGCTEEEAVQAWMEIIGKNYCEEVNP